MNQFGCKGTEKFAYMQEGSEILHKKSGNRFIDYRLNWLSYGLNLI